MSYVPIYYTQWTNREQDDCVMVLSLKDGVSSGTIQLTATDRPFTLRSQAQDNVIPYGIKATEAEIEFYSDDLVSLIDFYSEDDTAWLVQFYFVVSSTPVLKWQGFLQLDNCSEQITDISHIIHLNANDGLGRLQSQYFISTSLSTVGLPLIVNWTMLELVEYLLGNTGIDIDLKAWLNIFENSTDDRDVHNYLTFLPQTAFSTKYFVNDDGTTANLYEALNNILTDFRCMLTQAEGVWQIIRWGDVRIFNDGEMPGTLYTNGGGAYEEILFDASLDIGRGEDNSPINENQRSTILRPFEFSKETFNYEQPRFITQQDFSLPTGATPYATHTDGDWSYADYDLATYFPEWIQRGGDGSYLETGTNSVTNEIISYIVTPGNDAIMGGVQFNPIPVTAGDILDFSVSWRTDVDTDDLIRFWVRFVIVTAVDTDYNMANTAAPGVPLVRWVGPSVSADLWDTGEGIYKEYTNPTDIDTTQWQSWSISEFLPAGATLPLIPADGMLLIEVRAANSGSETGRQTIYWKEVTVTMNQAINQSNNVIGQTHNNSQDAAIKNNLQYEVVFDDAPRNTIKGTLFTDALTNFDYTDINTGASTDIGNIYFTKTVFWHRQGVTEDRRLGDLNTYNDLFIQRKVRTIVEGDFYGLQGVSIMRLVNFTWLSPKKFIFGAASFDYMSCIWNASLYEIFETGEVDADLDNTYTFNYLYQT